ncbi:DNA primase small subunit, partial [Raphidocelis subcapitata]
MSTPDAKRVKLEGGGADAMAVDDTQPGHSGGDQQAAAAAAAKEAAPKCTREQMQSYYSRLFPAQQMFKWLAYGNDSSVPGADPTFTQRRELCFTLEGDIFARYQSFATSQSFASALATKVPTKIDIGPVYTVDPRQRAKYAKDFRPVQRELVFDVDLTDYDDVRTCGSGGHICGRCWPLMAAAVVVVDEALRRDFGFRHVCWVYSGRRGVHCWVADE